MKLSAHLFAMLHRSGVEHAFGIPGDFALGLFDALAKSPIEPVVMCHEPGVGFAADAYARVRGLGAAVVTYGVGALNMVNCVAQAYAEKSPLVVVSGAPGVRERREHELLHHKVKTFESQLKVYQEVTAYATVLNNPLTANLEIHTALAHARTFKRPVYLEVPRDMVGAEIEERGGSAPPVKRLSKGALHEALEETVAMLKQAASPVMVADVEVQRFGLQAEVLALAEKLGVPVCSTMLGKSAFPEFHPQYVGVYTGEIGTPGVRERVENSDCLLMLGTFMSDINLGWLTARLPVSNSILATSERVFIRHHEYDNVDFAEFVRRLGAREDLPRQDPSHIRPMVCGVERCDGPITMSGLIHELNEFIDDNTLLVNDVGDALFAADDIRTHQGTSFICPAFYASMGFGIPGAIGAMLAAPGRQAVVLIGDGAFQMTGLELAVAAKLKLHPIVIVVNNGCYATLRTLGGGDRPWVHIPRLDYAALAEALGGKGFAVETGEQFRNALRTAKGLATFALLDVRMDPEDCSPALARLRRTLQENKARHPDPFLE